MTVSINRLKELFDAERITSQPTLVELEFMKQRTEIATSLSYNLSIEEFLVYKDLIEEYGLTGEMLIRVEGEIWYRSYYEQEQFRNSKFYSLFKDHKLVKKHFDESRIDKN